MGVVRVKASSEVLTRLGEMAGLLHELGMTAAEAKVREGTALAGDDPEKAAEVLAAAAALVAAAAPEARRSD
jgi:hypothetical protein